MIQRSNQSIECSRGGQLRRGGSSEGRLGNISRCFVPTRWGSHTQWLLLQDEEDGIDQFEVLGEVVELQQGQQLSESAKLGTAKNVHSIE